MGPSIGPLVRRQNRAPGMLLGGIVILLAALAALTQRRFEEPRLARGMLPIDSDVALGNAVYDGRLTFARLRFVSPPAGYYYRGLPAWAHGYPRAERNLMRIIDEISALHPHVHESNVFTWDDPALNKCPIAYMTEAGFWTLTDAEAAACRAYLQKGGFVIFDDFRDDQFRGGGGWAHFESNMRRVIPEARFLDLDPSHRIFHSFFEINSFDIIPQDYDAGRPTLRGLFEDNDPHKHLMAMVNFNTDISNYWEFSGTGVRPVAESNEAYKLGVNYVMYAMTH